MIRHETHAATVVLVGTVVQIALFGHPTRPDLTMKNKRLWTGTKLMVRSVGHDCENPGTWCLGGITEQKPGLV